MNPQTKAVTVAWLMTALYYFYQYMLRSAPAVMLPQLSGAFDLSASAVASMMGLFYYGYSPFSLVAGVAMDRLGPEKVLPIGAATVGAGALLFASGDVGAAGLGRFLQGAGGVFALVGAAYLVTTNFEPFRAATLIGATQMFGMAGGSAGQFLVGPLIASGVPWNAFWAFMGVAGLAMSGVLFLFVPPSPHRSGHGADWLKEAIRALSLVFRNPQSILCGMSAGLLFLPTTIFDMVWGVRYLQEARGFDYASAVMRSATVPLGWMIGCPLLGMFSDRLGRRKPVIIAGGAVLFGSMVWILFGPSGVFPPYVLGLVAGLASGAAMLPYTVIKEANPPNLSGTATGVVNFINFTFSALLGPVFGWLLATMIGAGTAGLEHYQQAFEPMVYGVGLAMLLTFFLNETGPAVGRLTPAAARKAS